MRQNKRSKKPPDKFETIWELEARLRQEARELARNHKDIKPIKYLLK